jgi:hypothetical protein
MEPSGRNRWAISGKSSKPKAARTSRNSSPLVGAGARRRSAGPARRRTPGTPSGRPASASPRSLVSFVSALQGPSSPRRARRRRRHIGWRRRALETDSGTISAGRARRRSHGYPYASRSQSPREASSRGMHRERPSCPPSDQSLQPWCLSRNGCTSPASRPLFCPALRLATQRALAGLGLSSGDSGCRAIGRSLVLCDAAVRRDKLTPLVRPICKQNELHPTSSRGRCGFAIGRMTPTQRLTVGLLCLAAPGSSSIGVPYRNAVRGPGLQGDRVSAPDAIRGRTEFGTRQACVAATRLPPDG